MKAAEKTIEGLMAKILEMKKELDGYRSVRGQIKVGELERENRELRMQNRHYREVVEKNELEDSILNKYKEKVLNR